MKDPPRFEQAAISAMTRDESTMSASGTLDAVRSECSNDCVGSELEGVSSAQDFGVSRCSNVDI